MGFNLKEKLLNAKTRGSAALAFAVIAADDAAGRAIEKMSDLKDAAQEKAANIRATVSEKVDDTKAAVQGTVAVASIVYQVKKEAVKQSAAEKLGALGDAIDEKAHKLSTAAADFGKSARRKLNGTEPQPAIVAESTPAAVAKTKPKLQKPSASKAGKGKKKKTPKTPAR